MTNRTSSWATIASLGMGTLAVAQQQKIPVRELEPASARATEPLGAVLGIKELADGRVLVSDAGRLRLMVFGADLKTFTIVSDTTATAKNKYGDSPAPITPYTGDSTLFSPFYLRAFLVLDPQGEVVRVAAFPKPADIQFINGSRTAIDPRGRLLYRARLAPVRGAPPPATGTFVTQAPDSAPIVRADFDTRRVDTVAHVRTPKQQRTERTMSTSGGVAATKVFVTPVSIVDDWTMTSDGTIAIVRGQDYHIDWISPDGALRSTPKMPFDWRRMTDDEKQRLADSATKSWRDALDRARERTPAAPPRALPAGAIGGRMIAMFNQAEGTSVSMPIDAVVESLPLSEMPDYFPPLRAGTVRADLEGNVWILPYTSARSTNGGIVYDVVNRQGELFERVQLPPERSIAGFGRAGTLYLTWRDTTKVWHLEKTRVKR